MTPQNSPREIAFWLDAAMLSLENYDGAVRDGDETVIHAHAKTLVSVSCEYESAWNDARAAETFAQIDGRLRALAGNPEGLRHAFRAASKSHLWNTGEYAKLLAGGRPGRQA
jgi:hypothetical protein